MHCARLVTGGRGILYPVEPGSISRFPRCETTNPLLECNWSMLKAIEHTEVRERKGGKTGPNISEEGAIGIGNCGSASDRRNMAWVTAATPIQLVRKVRLMQVHRTIRPRDVVTSRDVYSYLYGKDEACAEFIERSDRGAWPRDA